MPIATLADIVRHHRTAQAESIALSFEGHDTSYALLDRRANQISNGLARMGVHAGARVALLDKNNDSFFEIWFGAAKANVVLVPINWRLAAPEITYIVNDAQARVLFVGTDYLETRDRIRNQLKTVRRVIVTDRDFAAWRDRQSDADPELPIAGGDVCVQVYTSGTTGRPKGAQLTNDNLMTLLARLNSGKWREWSTVDVSLVVMPLFHVAGSVYGLCGLYVGARNVLLREVVPQQILEVIDRDRVSKTCLVPAVILMLLDDPSIHMADLSSLQLMFYGASPIPIELLRNALAVFKCDFVQLYGLTETGGGITYLGAEEHADLVAERLLSCGRPMDGVEIRIVDAQGNSLPPRQVGEIICRSAQVMKGYWNLPDETAKAVRGEWFYTGDAGYLDEVGFLYIHDRVKDMIVSGGENIYPAEVESALYGHPAIADVAVIGVPDDRWGEAVKAIVVLKPGQKGDAAEVIAYARERVAGYKLPKSIDFVDSLPRNPSGKIIKRALRAILARAEAPDPLTIPPNDRLCNILGFPIARETDKWDVRTPRLRSGLPIRSGSPHGYTRTARCQTPTDRNHPLPEWPTFRPEHLSGCFRPTRSSGCWRSTGSTWRRNITKAIARIFHQPIWLGEISRALICAGSRWTAPCSAGLISAEPISKARTSSAPLQSMRASTVRIYPGRA